MEELKGEYGIEEDLIIWRNLGYVGKRIIHPNQIPIVNNLLYPTQSEIEWAKKVCQVYVESIKKNKGATAIEGKMIDEVHFKRAKALLESVNT